MERYQMAAAPTGVTASLPGPALCQPNARRLREPVTIRCDPRDGINERIARVADYLGLSVPDGQNAQLRSHWAVHRP